LLREEEADAIEREKIFVLANSPLAERLRKATANNRLFREVPFVLAVEAALLYPDADAGEKILVHGIIDCCFEENEKMILVDFKSDFIPPNISTRDWAKKHSVQMEIYKQALTKSAKMEVAEILLYSFSRGEAVSL
jgi:ATP-dependent helicase/nuclease subunit A